MSTPTLTKNPPTTSGKAGGQALVLKRTGRGLSYLALFCYAVFLGGPLLWLITTSFKTPQELGRLNPSLLPDSFSFANYATAFKAQNLVGAAGNSVIVAVATTLLVTVVSIPAAYGLARYRTKIQSAATAWILVSQVFPVILVIIPLFLILKQFGLPNTLIGLILVNVVYALPFSLWMLQGYVVSIPKDLEEAASTDGAGRLRVLVQIVMPLLMPGIVATAMFTFVSAWNEFFFALVLIQDPELNTLPLALAKFVGAEGQVQLGPLAAGSVMATIPSLIFFAVIQRKLVSGMMSGAVKG